MWDGAGGWQCPPSIYPPTALRPLGRAILTDASLQAWAASDFSFHAHNQLY